MEIFGIKNDINELKIIVFGIKIKFNKSEKTTKKIKEKEFKELLLKTKRNEPSKNNKSFKKIYVIGESHTNFFGGNEFLQFKPYKNGVEKVTQLLDCFTPYHLGPVTAYNAVNSSSQTKGFEKIQWLLRKKIIPSKSIILLSLGEIDIRCHVIKQSEKQNKSIEEIIDIILVNYLQLIKYLQSRGFKIITWGPIASQKDDWTNNPDYPKVGSELQRNYATEIFNAKLEALSQKNGFVNCSIYKKLVNVDNTTISEYIADQCHLSQSALPLMIEEFANKGILQLDKKGTVVINYPLFSS